MRRRALASSSLYGFFLVWLRIPAMLLAKMSTEPLRKYVREPYARAAYPGGLEEEELVALGVVLSIFGMLFIGFSAAVVLGPGYLWFGVLGLPVGFLGMVSYFKTRIEIREVADPQGDAVRAGPDRADPPVGNVADDRPETRGGRL